MARNFTLEHGMEVVDANGQRAGTIESILTENRTGMSRFVTVDRRILPVEAIRGVEEGRVRLDLPKDRLRRFPERGAEEIPPPDVLQKAYREMGLDGPAVDEPPR